MGILNKIAKKNKVSKGTDGVVTVAQKPSRGSFGMDLLAWSLFLVAVFGWGAIFYTKFTEFDEYNREVQDEVLALLTKGADDVIAGAVLGEVDGQISETEANEGEEVVAETTAEAEEGTDGVSEETSEDDIAAVVDSIEEDRIAGLREKIDLELPDETDNPNYAATFSEPTEEGVEIQVDGEGFSKKKSPYKLPSLSIGKHTLNFRFKDEDDVMQNFAVDITVIPRVPVFDESQQTEFNGMDVISFSGTAMPNSKVVLMVSGSVVTDVVDADDEGNWSYVVSEDLTDGEHSVVAMVRKDGYASNFSDPLSFTLGEVEGVSDSDVGSSSGSSFFSIEDYVNEDNYLYMIPIGGVVLAIVLIIAYTILKSVFSRGKKDEVVIKQTSVNGGKGPAKSNGKKNEKELSLREKFEKSGLDVNGAGKGKPKKSDDTEQAEDEKEKPDKSEAEEKVEKEGVVEEKVEKKPKEKKKKEKKENKDEKPVEQSTKQPKPEKEEKGGMKDKLTPQPVPGKVYSKDEFMKEFDDEEGEDTGKGSKKQSDSDSKSEAKSSGETSASGETNKIKISLTSKR